jgi:hypothetical protein
MPKQPCCERFIYPQHEKHSSGPGPIPPQKHPGISVTHEILFPPQYLGDQRKFYHANLDYTLVLSISRSLALALAITPSSLALPIAIAFVFHVPEGKREMGVS